MLARGIPFVLLLVSSSAIALDTTQLGQFGSLGLDEMMPLIDKSLQLKREVGDAVAKAKVKADEVGCEGKRFPGQWRNLGGGRTAPYVCKIGDKWLEVRATVRVTGRGGSPIRSPEVEEQRRGLTLATIVGMVDRVRPTPKGVEWRPLSVQLR
jgi:hypothetical protein